MNIFFNIIFFNHTSHYKYILLISFFLKTDIIKKKIKKMQKKNIPETLMVDFFLLKGYLSENVSY